MILFNVVIVSFGGSVCDWVINASRMDVSIFYSLMIVCLYVCYRKKWCVYLQVNHRDENQVLVIIQSLRVY